MPGHVYGDAVIVTYMYSHCESSPGSSDECRSAPDGRRPSETDLGVESACICCYSFIY